MKIKRYRCVPKNDAWGQGVLILNYYLKINNFYFGILATTIIKKDVFLKRFDNYFFYGRIIEKQNIVSKFKINSVFLKRSFDKKRLPSVVLNFFTIKKIRILFCYFLLAIFFIFSPILKMLLKTKFCEKSVKKIFFILNRFLLKSNKICWNCGDTLNLDTKIEGWLKGLCEECGWMRSI